MADGELAYEDFAGKQGQIFTLAEEGIPPVPLTLTECGLLEPRYVPKSGRKPFVLLFAAETVQALPQRLFRMHHETLGLITLFLVPVGKDERGFLHEAVFN